MRRKKRRVGDSRCAAAPVLGRRSLARELARVKKKGKVIAFTNGCFDLLHPGHLWLLARAKASGDILIVGLNSDSSVRALKGSGHPLMSEKERAALVAGLRWVDYVVVFPEETPAELIAFLRPDVLVKGSDYSHREIVGAREVESWGGRVVRVKRLGGYSSTALRTGVRRRLCDGR